MFQPQNPFLQSMTRMQLPAGMGKSIAVAGFTIEADEDGCVEVPASVVVSLQDHGLTVVPPKAAKKAA